MSDDMSLLGDTRRTVERSAARVERLHVHLVLALAVVGPRQADALAVPRHMPPSAVEVSAASNAPTALRETW